MTYTMSRLPAMRFLEFFGSTWIIVLLVFSVVVLLAFWLLRLLKYKGKQSENPRLQVRTTVNAKEITRISEKGILCQQIQWDEIEVILINTTDKGPFVDDVFFVFRNVSQKKEVVIPQEDPEMPAILDRISQLPRFDHEAMNAAMSCTENAWFAVWEKES